MAGFLETPRTNADCEIRDSERLLKLEHALLALDEVIESLHLGRLRKALPELPERGRIRRLWKLADRPVEICC